MDSTSATPGCLPGHTHHHATYAELTDAYWLEPPIYTHSPYVVDEVQDDTAYADEGADGRQEPQHSPHPEFHHTPVHAFD
ncbi:hypothetical protein [Streptomyces jeddahensis]|uniref:Uncharacterized protein n=1 Tax=Streptomyces jeddahensis TaxID=1716141 RepID=A0A177HPE6_9ACTN|nr:hypothetical protein [Streptomyces jeddahensis]OAH12606.1 hypothetical protein STSP_39520 [Streptomyces jeddahensis]